MIPTRDDIVAAARAWVGVRWRHQGRSRRHGVDCFGLLVLVGRDLGIPVADETGYSRVPDGFSFEAGMRARFEPIGLDAAGPGDVLVFADGHYPCHTGVRSDQYGAPAVIHAHARRRRVTEEPLAEEWGGKLRFAFRWRGVSGGGA